MYLNVYQPRLQSPAQVAAFFRNHRGHTFASSALMDPISKAFIANIEKYVQQNKIPLIPFAKKQRKDDVAKEHLATVLEEIGRWMKEGMSLFAKQWQLLNSTETANANTG